jgi:hypothetical protein
MQGPAFRGWGDETWPDFHLDLYEGHKISEIWITFMVGSGRFKLRLSMTRIFTDGQGP